MSKNPISKILSSPDKEVGKTSGPNGMLSRLFRCILQDLNIGPYHWNSLMADYLKDPRNGVPNTRKDHTSMRGNITKEFSRPQMTWKVFCKAMRFFQFVRIDICITAYHKRGGKTTLHSTTVDFGSKDMIDDYDESEGDHEKHQTNARNGELPSQE